jgi:hypothetical protein
LAPTVNLADQATGDDASQIRDRQAAFVSALRDDGTANVRVAPDFGTVVFPEPQETP